MSRSNEREYWNQKHSDRPDRAEPDPFLVEAFSKFVQPIFSHGGSALDFAGGAGRHSIFLAERGWDVTLIDISDIAIEKARRNAGSLSPNIHFAVDDLTTFRASQTQFDLVMVLSYLDRAVFPELLKSIRPDGLILYKSYTTQQRFLEGGPKAAEHLLEPGELQRLVEGMEVMHYKEKVAARATAEVVAKKGSRNRG